MKVVQYGTGKMSVYTMRYVYEKGGEIVGAIDVNKDVIGKDIGDIMGTEKKGVTVTALEDAEKMLQEVKPDIAIVTTMSLISDVKDALIQGGLKEGIDKAIDSAIDLGKSVTGIFTGCYRRR